MSSDFPRPFGDYSLLAHLGEGGMGAVFLASKAGFGSISQLCVIKTVRGDRADEEKYKRRFEDEARVVVQLNHRNICHVSDVGAVDETYYLAMEYIMGKTLAETVEFFSKGGEPMPTAVAMHIICEVLEALDYAHRHRHAITGEPLRVVHRDVSPHNVMVNFEGEVKLIDFGLAVSTLKEEKTAPNTIVGKLLYLAPEQAAEKPVGPWTDVFSTAVMAYELLSGHRYYAGLGRDQVIHGVIFGHTPASMSALDKPVQKILRRALQHDPEKRYQSAGEMREDIDDYLAGRGLRASARGLRNLMTRAFSDDERAMRRMLQETTEQASAQGEERFANQPTRVVRIATRPDNPVLVDVDPVHRVSTTPANLIADSGTDSTSLPLNPTQLAPPSVPPTQPVAPPLPETGSVDGAEFMVPQRSNLVRIALIAGAATFAFIGVLVLLQIFAGGPEAPPEIDVPTLPAPPLVVATPDPPVVDAGPAEPLVVLTKRITKPRPVQKPKPKVRKPRSKRPPPTQVTNLIEAIDYLDKHCRRRVRCANPIVSKRATLANMEATALVSLFGSARQCIARCKK